MSAEYFLFTEMNINNQWHCINPLVMVIPDSYKQTDKDYDISYTYYSGSRSGFGRTADMLIYCNP